jgi:hypothetical protein
MVPIDEGLFWSAISLWEIFVDHPAPPGCPPEEWDGLEEDSFRLYTTLGELKRASDVARVVDVVEAMSRACDSCDRRLVRVDPPGVASPLAEKARRHLKTVRRELQRHRRAVLMP